MVKKKKKKHKIPLRINILFFSVFLLFSVLVVQLGVIQIIKGESYQVEIDKTIYDLSKTSVPRGKIYDSKHRIVVDNKAMYSITYTPPKRVQSIDKLILAEKLEGFMSVDKDQLKKITDRNKKDYWFLKNTEQAIDYLNEEEKKLSDIEQYKLAIERITESDISYFTEEQLRVMAIKRELDKAYELTPQIIKNKDISTEEYAKIAEHLSELPGINVSTDWDRAFVFGDTLRPIFGTITTQDQGLPAEEADFYLTRGYNRNDRVGKSGLEQEYEDLLRGRKEQIQYNTTKSGTVIGSEVIVQGELGKDLILTIDMELQEKVDQIVEEELKTMREQKPGSQKHLTDALAVINDPKTGDLLALSAIHYNEEKDIYEKTPFRALYDAHRAGSVIKGASVLAGLDSGVISPGQVFYDRPIKIKETPTKGSFVYSLGSVNDITALQRSSNVYMYYIGLRLGGEFRYPFPSGSKASFNSEGFQVARNYFHQFGLGSATGIDYPFESTGFAGTERNPGLLMDLMIGQYDTYTTLQLAQYVATIANDGYRSAAKLVKEVRNPSVDGDLGAIFQTNDTKVLNRIEADSNYIDRVQEGFWKVFNESGGTGYRHWSGKSYKPAGKTGTAENEIFENGKKIAGTINLNLVGYAPYDDPEVSFAVVVPNISSESGQYPINHKIGTRIMDAYFDMKKDQNKNTDVENQEDLE